MSSEGISILLLNQEEFIMDLLGEGHNQIYEINRLCISWGDSLFGALKTPIFPESANIQTDSICLILPVALNGQI